MNFEYFECKANDVEHANDLQLVQRFQLADHHPCLSEQANQQNPVISRKNGQLDHFRQREGSEDYQRKYAG